MLSVLFPFASYDILRIERIGGNGDCTNYLPLFLLVKYSQETLFISEDDLSSDTGEDKIYDEPPDLFNEDVKRYGEAYAKYKARVMSENPDLANSKSLVQCSRVQEDQGYKDDSDDGFYYGEEEDTDQFKEQYRDDPSSDEYSPDWNLLSSFREINVCIFLFSVLIAIWFSILSS